MTSTASMSDKAAYCLAQAQAAKAAGNAALQSGNVRGAAFQYKRVYLYLAEHLPDSVVAAASPAALSSSGGHNRAGGSATGDPSNDGLVQLLSQQRRKQQRPSAATAPACSALPPQPPSATSSSALSPTAPAPSPSPSPVTEMVPLYATTLNNLALAYLKLGRYREGVTCVSAVLEVPALRAALDNTSGGSAPLRPCETPAGKALQRRASCYVKLCEWAAAEADLQALAALSPATTTTVTTAVPKLGGVGGQDEDPAVVQLRRALEEGRQAEAAKEKKMMQRMFA